MLTIQSNLKIQDLETLSKTLIKPDIINFGLNKVGGGYTDKIADKVIAKLSKLDKDKTIVIINDITLQMADKLLEAGYRNLYLAFGSFNKDETVSKDKTVYNIMKAVIENNIKEKLNAISLEEIFNMKIDGIIANPPYGAIGANITKKIIDEADFEEFINLEPSVDYITRTTNSLKIYNYIELPSISKQVGGFEDAAVIPSIMRISKTEINDLSLEEFYLCTVDGDLLKPYFKLNSARAQVATIIKNKVRQFGLDTTNALFFGQRVTSGNHGGKVNLISGPNTTTYKLNNHLITLDDYYKSKPDNKGRFRASILKLNSNIEYQNALKFLYSSEGTSFCNMLGTAMNRDFFEDFDHLYWFPRVDWTKEWTVREILADYGYTQDKIEEVISSLDNFKGADK